MDESPKYPSAFKLTCSPLAILNCEGETAIEVNFASFTTTGMHWFSMFLYWIQTFVSPGLIALTKPAFTVASLSSRIFQMPNIVISLQYYLAAHQKQKAAFGTR